MAPIIELLKEKWNLFDENRNLVLNILGGIDPNMERRIPYLKEFVQDLVKLTACTKALLITKGLDSGLAKAIGDAVYSDVDLQVKTMRERIKIIDHQARTCHYFRA